MAKPLKFKVNNTVYNLEPKKLDRKKLYGWKEITALDTNGNGCTALSLYPKLGIIIPKGGVGLGVISEEGNWVEKSDMMYINEDGSPAPLVPSSYDGEIELNKTVSLEFFLEHNIVSIYALQGEENVPEFIQAIKETEEIFTFTFNYRADYEGDPAFLIENGGEIFVLVGKKIEFEFIGIEERGILDEDEEETEEEFDFFMM